MHSYRRKADSTPDLVSEDFSQIRTVNGQEPNADGDVVSIPSLNQVLTESSLAPVADGTYTVGKGSLTDGTITVASGIITAIQEASDV